MKYYKIVLCILTFCLLIVSCTPNDSNENREPLGSYEKGVLVLNQGGFGKNDSSLSFISSDLSSIQNDIFSIVNPSITLGDTGQSIGIYNDLAYVVLNGSNKIEIVNRYTMKSMGNISGGLKNPRYIAFANGKAYVTNWGDGSVKSDDFIAVIDLASKKVTGSIPVIEGPECLIAMSGKLYVAQKGGYGYGNKITVVDLSSNAISTTIEVGDVPENMVVKDGTLWVACSGIPSWATGLTESPGQIVKVSTATDKVTERLAYTEPGKHLNNMAISENDVFYCMGSDVFKMNTSATALPTTSFFNTSSQGTYGIYSFAVNKGNIYVGDAVDYKQNGKVFIYNRSDAALQKSFTVQVVPAGFYFNE